MQLRLRGWGWRHAGRRAWALRGVDLDVAPGERVLLLGRSGAGKSTLLQGVAGLLDPDAAEETEGDALLDGVPARAARGRAGLLQQDPASNLVMARAGDDVAFGLENRGVPAGEIWPQVHAALDAVGFPHGVDRSTSGLSGGEAQRLALAGVVALRPGLLLLDEPTASLDPEGVLLVRDAVSRAVEQTGATLLLVEHRPAPWLDLVDRVVVLGPDGVQTDGSAAAVLSGRVGAGLAADGVWVPGFEPGTSWNRRAAVGDPLLVADAVRHRYRGSDRDSPMSTSLEIRAGEALALTGRNGAGKSTLALALGGLLKPTGGAVRATPALDPDTRPLVRWRSAALAAAVGSVFQRPEQQFLTSRVRDEVAVGVARHPKSHAVERRTGELLGRLGLTRLAGADPHTLSGGEQRRLSVATVLATAPRVLVLDEPTFGQDARTWAELVALLQELLDEGRGLAVVTHDLPLLAALQARTLELR